MVNIGICDDVPEVVEKLSIIISDIMREMNSECKIEKFYSGVEVFPLLYQLDALFLDIEMPRMDGIQVGLKMQEYNSDCKIIMATGRVERFKEAFRIKAFRFITKPFDKDEIEMVLYETLQELRERKTIELYLNRIAYEIEQKDILFVKAYESYVGVMVKKIGMMRKDLSLTKIIAFLDDRLFYRVNRRYIVNLIFVESYKKGIVKVAGMEIKISNVKKKDFEKKYEEFKFKYK